MSVRVVVAFIVVVFFGLAGCATNPIPDGYTGPTAQFADSVMTRGMSSGDFFYLEKIDGKSIENSLGATLSANYGQGFRMTPVVKRRAVPAAEASFTIVARTHYAAPILVLANKIYQVRGDVRFTPEPNGSYVVKGVLGPDYSAVWIEDSRIGAMVGQKVEVQGSATLGFFEK